MGTHMLRKGMVPLVGNELVVRNPYFAEDFGC